MLSTLTDHEYLALNSACSFADGHAYHELPKALEGVVVNLPAIWQACQDTPVPVMEVAFKRAWADMLDSSSLQGHQHFKVCPTASNSIDIVATLLAEQAPRVLLVEPTFDNLFLMLRRRGCSLLPLEEPALIEAIEADQVEALLDGFAFDTLFLVNPNNPTGYLIRERQFEHIAEYCKRRGKLLVVDSTFRFYNREPFDDYAALVNSGVSFVVIEDTGKTWPTHDMKSSMIVYSADLAKRMQVAYEEIYLCHSRFVMGVFVDLFRRTAMAGVGDTITDEMASRRARVRAVLAGTGLRPVTDERRTVMPVEWVDISATGKSDRELIDQLLAQGFHCLPGSHFYWHRYYQEGVDRSSFIRLSLARPQQVFDDGLALMRRILHAPDLVQRVVGA